MVKNKNNSSTKLGDKIRQSPCAMSGKGKSVKLPEDVVSDRITRSKRSRSVDRDRDGDRSEGKPSAKQAKLACKIDANLKVNSKRMKRSNQMKSGTDIQIQPGCSNDGLLNEPQDAVVYSDQPIVGSARSLINSIKTGKLGKTKSSVYKATPVKKGNKKPKIADKVCNLANMDLSAKRSRSNNNDALNKFVIAGLDRNVGADDGVEVGVNSSEDDYSGESEVSESEESDLAESSSDSGEISSNESEPSDESEEEQLDRNDPRVKKLLEQI